MSTEDLRPAEEDDVVIALGPAQLAAVLAVLVIAFVMIRARKAR